MDFAIIGGTILGVSITLTALGVRQLLITHDADYLTMAQLPWCAVLVNVCAIFQIDFDTMFWTTILGGLAAPPVVWALVGKYCTRCRN